MFKSKYIKSFAAGLVLASGLFMSSGSSLAAKNFTDIYADKSHVAGVTYLNSLNVFDYKTSDKLNGNEGVTRAEAAKVLHSYYGDSIPPERTYNNNFKDVNNKTLYQDSIAWVYESKIMDGDAKGNFNPNQVLTRAQMAKILVNAFLISTDGTSNFKDVSTNHWAYEYINILGTEGYSIGSNGNFMPESKVTLNQLATFMYRIIDKELNISGTQSMTGSVVSSTEPIKGIFTNPKLLTNYMASKWSFLDQILAADEINSIISSVTANADYKTYDEVFQMYVDLYNKKPFAVTELYVYTKTDIGAQLEQQFNTFSHDISEYLTGYNNPFLVGKNISIYSEEYNSGLYVTTISLDTVRGEEEQVAFDNKIANTVEYIKDNYDTSSDYNKVLAVNEFLAEQLTYGVSTRDDHPYLGWGGSLCQDYANFTSLLLSGLGLQVRTVTGTADNGEGHAWNAVKVGGIWYHTDATWYDGDGQKNQTKYLLMSESERRAGIPVIGSDFRATDIPYTK